MIISINGMDNSGKTTQSKILINNYPNIFVKKIHINETPSFNKEKFNYEWWFSKDNAEEFVNSIYKCLEERIQIAKQISNDSSIVIMEKGLDFYDTRIVATLISKGFSLKGAVDFRNQIRAKYSLEDVEDEKIYLMPTGNKKDEDFDLYQDILYRQYLVINELLLRLANIDYTYINSGSLEEVTNNILLACGEEVRKKYERQKTRTITGRL